MPHGQTWLTLLLQKLGLYDTLTDKARALSWPVNDQGLTWVGHVPIRIEPVLGTIFVIVFLLLPLALLAYRRVRNVQGAIVPDAKLTARTFTELLVGATYDMMSDMMGRKAAKQFLPLIGTCAFFILFSNALGLVPGFAPPTDSLNTTLACAIVIFVATHLYGFKEHGFGYVKHFFGPMRGFVWLPLMLLMFAIETISHIVRPVSLSIRLMANMFADHQVVGIFHSLFAPIVPFFPMLLGSMVIVIQTLVFCMLSTVYIAMAIAHEEH